MSYFTRPHVSFDLIAHFVFRSEEAGPLDRGLLLERPETRAEVPAGRRPVHLLPPLPTIRLRQGLREVQRHRRHRQERGQG